MFFRDARRGGVSTMAHHGINTAVAAGDDADEDDDNHDNSDEEGLQVCSTESACMHSLRPIF